MRGGRNPIGTRPEPIGGCVATAEAAHQAVPRFDSYGVPPRRRFRIVSIAHTKARDGLRSVTPRRGENPGSPRGVQVRRSLRRRSFGGRRDRRASNLSGLQLEALYGGFAGEPFPENRPEDVFVARG